MFSPPEPGILTVIDIGVNSLRGNVRAACRPHPADRRGAADWVALTSSIRTENGTSLADVENKTMTLDFASADYGMMSQMTPLHEQRLDVALQVLKETGAETVVDLGCGSGALLSRLAVDPQFKKIRGLEPSGSALQQARHILAPHLACCSERIGLIRGSYTDSHPQLAGYDAAAMIETIEHVRPEQLSRVERAVFTQMRPMRLFMTTPNQDYNPLFDLGPGEFRETDHKFEWSRAKFRRWVTGVAGRNGYKVTFGGIGDIDPELGYPTQTALFTRTGTLATANQDRP